MAARVTVGLLALLAAALLPAAGPRAAVEEPRTPLPVPPLFGGIQVNEPDHDRWAHAVREAGLDSVQVTLYARQQAWDGATLYWDREAPWVVSEIRAARRAGLRVALVMRVALEHGLSENQHLWHGMIWPRPELVDEWFRAYGDFVAWGARLATAERVDFFVLGNELNALTSTTPVSELPDLYAYHRDSERVAAVNARLVACAEQVAARPEAADLRRLDGGRFASLEALLTDRAGRHRAWVRAVAPDVATLARRRSWHEVAWRALIERVRELYVGPVSYGANFDQFEQVAFWDALDALAVTGYFSLSEYGLQQELGATMRRRWVEIAARLEATAALPVVLLELGWTRRAGSTVRPYSYDLVEVLETAGSDDLTCVHWASQPEAPGERTAAMEALAATVAGGGFEALRGFTLWKLTTRSEHRAIEPFAISLDVPGAGTRLDRADADLLAAARSAAENVRGR